MSATTCVSRVSRSTALGLKCQDVSETVASIMRWEIGTVQKMTKLWACTSTIWHKWPETSIHFMLWVVESLFFQKIF